MSNSLRPCDYTAHQTPLFMGFPRQEQWSGLPCPPPGDPPTQDETCVSYISCIGTWVLYHQHHLGNTSIPSKLFSLLYSQRKLTCAYSVMLTCPSFTSFFLFYFCSLHLVPPFYYCLSKVIFIMKVWITKNTSFKVVKQGDTLFSENKNQMEQQQQQN